MNDIFKWTARGLSLFSMVFTAGYWISKHMDKRDMKRWNGGA